MVHFGARPVVPFALCRYVTSVLMRSLFARSPANRRHFDFVTIPLDESLLVSFLFFLCGFLWDDVISLVVWTSVE